MEKMGLRRQIAGTYKHMRVVQMSNLMDTNSVSLVVAITLLIVTPAFGQQPYGEEILEPVVVSASRSQTKIEEMPLHTTIITQEEIQKSPVTTLDQLLRNVPGMNFTGVPGGII